MTFNKDFFIARIVQTSKTLVVDRNLLLYAVTATAEDKLNKKDEPELLEDRIILQFATALSIEAREKATACLSSPDLAIQEQGRAVLKEAPNGIMAQQHEQVSQLTRLLASNEPIRFFHLIASSKALEKVMAFKFNYSLKRIGNIISECCPELITIVVDHMKSGGDFSQN